MSNVDTCCTKLIEIIIFFLNNLDECSLHAIHGHECGSLCSYKITNLCHALYAKDDSEHLHFRWWRSGILLDPCHV